MIPVVKENTKLNLALAIRSGTPVILANEIIDIPPLVADKTIKDFFDFFWFYLVWILFHHLNLHIY